MKAFVPALAAVALLAGTVAAVPAFAADPDRGEELFDTSCGDCHSMSARALNRKGPSLYRVVGRRAAAVAGFRYSPAMTASGIVWNGANLDAYLANPRARVPNGTMKFKGLPRPADRADIIAYLTNPDG